MVLTGQVNREIVGLINEHGPFAVGLSGEDAHLLTARRLQPEVNGELVDIGEVGEVESVNPGAVSALLADGRIPVISSVARSANGGVLNVNADTAAAAIAIELGAAKLVLLTDVAGLYPNWTGKDAASLADARPFSQLTADELAALMPGLSDGMLPKMEACLSAVRGGVPQAHVLDGRLPHAILLEIFTDSGIGTMVQSGQPQSGGTPDGPPDRTTGISVPPVLSDRSASGRGTCQRLSYCKTGTAPR